MAGERGHLDPVDCCSRARVAVPPVSRSSAAPHAMRAGLGQRSRKAGLFEVPNNNFVVG